MSTPELIIGIIAAVASISISAIIIRYIFRIDTIVKELKESRKELIRLRILFQRKAVQDGLDKNTITEINTLIDNNEQLNG